MWFIYVYIYICIYIYIYTHTHTHTHIYILSHVQFFAMPWTIQPARSLCPWNSPGKNTGVGCHFQGIVPTQGLNLSVASPALAGRFFTTSAPGITYGDTRDPSSISGSGRSPGGGPSNPLQYSFLGNLWTEEPGGLQSMGSHRVGH